MKIRKLLMLVVVMCMASVAKAQFYDSADEIYYYKKVNDYYEERRQVYWNGMPTLNFEKTGKVKTDEFDDSKGDVMVFNFDGRKAAMLYSASVSLIKDKMRESSSFFEDKVETTDYTMKYSAESFRSRIPSWTKTYAPLSGTLYEAGSRLYFFSSDREWLYIYVPPILNGSSDFLHKYKRVDKSFFKVGRSRTPSGTLRE